MMDDENKTELIDRYLDEELSPAENESFESSLAVDSELRLEVEAQNAVRNMIKQQGEKADLLRIFDEFHESIAKENVLTPESHGKIIDLNQILDESSHSKELFKVNWRNWVPVAVAASIALTILGVWTIVKDRNDFNNQQEIRNNADDEAFRIPFLTWRTINNKPVLQERKLIDLKITRKTKYKFHYRFKSFLEIYSDTLNGNNEKITLQFDPDLRVYKLWIGKKVFFITKTEEIIPLQ